MGTTVLLVIGFSKLLDLPLQPVNLWTETGSLPLQVRVISEGRYRISSGSHQWDLYYRRSENQHKIILRPPDRVTLSFRISEKVLSVRLTPNEGVPILQFATPGALSFSCDGFYFPSTHSLWKFSGPEFTLYDGETGGIKVKFTKNADTLTWDVLGAPPSPPPSPKDSQRAKNFWEKLREYLLSLAKGASHQDASPPQPASKEETEWRAYSALSAVLGLPLPQETQNAQPPVWTSRFRQSVETRPLDFFRISELPFGIITHTRIANQPSALFCLINPTPNHRSVRINLTELGLSTDYPWTLFDLLNLRYLSAATGALAITLSPYETRLYLMRRFMARPQVIGNDHSVWGLVHWGLQETWDAQKGVLHIGFISPPEGAEESLFIASAFDQGVWKPVSAFRNTEKWHLHPNLGCWRIPLFASQQPTNSSPAPSGESSPANSPRQEKGAPSQAPFTVQFIKEKAELLSAPEIGIGPGSPWAISLTRPTLPNDPYAGFYVFRNTTLIGYFTDPAYLDDEVDPECDYSYTVFGVGYGGDPSLPKTTYVHTPAPTDTPLVHLFPFTWTPALYAPQKNSAPDGKPLTLKGEVVSGWSVPRGGSLSFRLSRAFETLSGTVSPLQAWEGEAPLTFEVYGDGKLLFRSKPLSPGETETLEVDVHEVYLLELRVAGESGEGFGLWANPFLKAKRPGL